MGISYSTGKEFKTLDPTEYSKVVKNISESTGMCIVSWSEVEHQMSILFNSLVKSQAGVSFIIWASINSLKAKLDSLDAVVNVCVKDADMLGIWEKLKKKIDAESVWRNKVAHASIVQEDGLPFLMPHFSLSDIIGKKSVASKQKLTATEIEKITIRFQELSFSLSWYWMHIESKGDKFLSEHLEQAPQLIKNCYLAHQNKIRK